MKNIRPLVKKALTLGGSTFICLLVIHHLITSKDETEFDSSVVTGVENWKHGLKHAVWNQTYYRNDISFLEYNEYWEEILSMFNLNKPESGCNAIDIGANEGEQ